MFLGRDKCVVILDWQQNEFWNISFVISFDRMVSENVWKLAVELASRL